MEAPLSPKPQPVEQEPGDSGTSEALDFEAVPYHPGLAADWDRICAAAPGGTVLHSRRFLDYHGSRFRELGLLGRRLGETRFRFVLPLAASPSAPDLAVSHPGSTFGGVVGETGEPVTSRAFLRAAARALLDQGFRRLVYRATPGILLRQPDDGLLPDLLRLGRVTQFDLWSVLSLAHVTREETHWRARLRKAERRGLRAEPVRTREEWALLHDVVAGRLDRKYGRPIVHSVAELSDLHARLGPQSRALLVRDPQDRVIGGFWFIDYGCGTLHNQYNGATEAGLALGASSYGIALGLQMAKDEGFDRFSFGRSTAEDGWSENPALLRFKSRFGAGLAGQMHLELPLDSLVLLRP